MDVNKILTSDLLDLIFEGRNKAYGAYELRKTYKKRLTIALLSTALVAILALGGSLLASEIKKNRSEKVKINPVELAKIEEPEEKKVEPPPPPPPVKEPPKVEMTKFTPPKIVKDEEVKKEDIPPEQEKLEDTKIDIVNQEGIKDEGIAVPVIDQGKQIIEEKKPEDENKVFEKVEIEASFPGGERAWANYLRKNLDPNVPVDNGAPAGTYTVTVQFIVDKQGNISDVRALSKHGFGMEDEAVKIIKKGPSWEPAVQNGRKVNAYRRQPITFVVEEQ
ncbi:MAG: energy transducer TonB [Chitinophagales bacterium]|nr:energy transducer TonB [Chitinophagales bacterium]